MEHFMVIMQYIIGVLLIVASFFIGMFVIMIVAFSYDNPYQTWKETCIRLCLIGVPLIMFIGGFMLVFRCKALK